jgi:hypothetical protein
VRTIRVFEKSGMWLLLLVLISVASSSLIRWIALPKTPWVDLAHKQAKFNAAQDSKFQSLLDQAVSELNDARYADALSGLQEAERSLPQLSDDQYAALKKARLQAASAYERVGSSPEVEGVYKALADSALRDGDAHFLSRDLASALARYQDAETFSQHLIEDKERYWMMSHHAQVLCLREMQRYSDAAAITQQTLEYLQAAGDEYDPRIVQQYMELAQTYQLERDWEQLEQTINTAVPVCDKIIAHSAELHPSNDPTPTLLVSKDQMLYALMDAYDEGHKPDLALSTAEDLFTFISQHSLYAELGPHTRRDVANYALRIAAKTNRQDAADQWRQRVREWH